MKLHETCTTDQAAPQFDHEWQRRAFGLAVALAEFGHYRWADFQQNLIETIEHWQSRPESERGDWQYYDHWLVALEKVITDHHLLTALDAATRQSHGLTRLELPHPVPEKA